MVWPVAGISTFLNAVILSEAKDLCNLPLKASHQWPACIASETGTCFQKYLEVENNGPQGLMPLLLGGC
jgi:hypothetical protein